MTFFTLKWPKSEFSNYNNLYLTVTLKFSVLHQVRSYHIPMEQIERQLNDIETNLAHLEKEGVELEQKLRSCEEGTFYVFHFSFLLVKTYKY